MLSIVPRWTYLTLTLALVAAGVAGCSESTTDDSDLASKHSTLSDEQSSSKSYTPTDSAPETSALALGQSLGNGFDIATGSASATMLNTPLDVVFDSKGLVVLKPTRSITLDGSPASETWTFGVDVPDVGRQGKLHKPEHLSTDLGSNVVTSRYSDGMTSIYRRTPRGLKQEFNLATRPSGEGALTLSFATPEGFEPSLDAANQHLIMSRNGQIVFRWAKLKVFDANGTPVEAQFFANTDSYGFQISDTDVPYPLMVDPILLGASDPVPDGSNSQASERFGEVVTGVGDLDNDGFNDIIVGAPRYTNSEDEEGRFLVFRGSANGILNTANIAVELNATPGRLGNAVASLGDYNGDGHDDIAVAAFYNNGYNGSVFVYNGRTPTATEPEAIDTTAAWSQTGTNFLFGRSIAAGDVDCDGNTDLIVGVEGVDSGAGRIAIYFGTGSTFATTATTYTASQAGERLSWSLTVGNFNGDSSANGACDDILVGAPYWDKQFTGDDAGRVLVFLGNTSRNFGQPDWEYKGGQASSFHGYSVAAADLNGDGSDEIILSGYLFDTASLTDVGRVLVFNGVSPNSSLPLQPSSFQVGLNDGESFGAFVANADDVNQDGYEDLLVGAPAYTGVNNQEGAAYLFLGSQNGLSQGQYDWRGVGGDEGLGANSRYGRAGDGAGDVNNDGYDDFIVGAYGADVTDSQGNTISNAGQAFVYSGAPTCFADGQFWNDGDENPANPCEVCDASQGSTTGWTTVADTAMKACDDGDLCTNSDVCVSGVCVGTAEDCSLSPAQDCTEGYCDPATGQCETRGVESTVSCAPAECVSDTEAVAQGFCDGDPNDDGTGMCLVPTTEDCAPFRCDSGACLTSCSNDNNCMTGAWCDTATNACSTENRAPVADAGADQVVTAGDSVTLDGSGSSDPDGDDLTPVWIQQGGEPATLTGDDTLTPQFTAPEPASGNELLTFQLVVNDGEANSQPDTATVLIRNQPNEKPTAAITGPDEAEGGQTITLSGADSTDPDDDDLSFTWSRASGRPLPTLGDSDGEDFEISFPEVTDDTTYSFLLVVNDGNVNSDPVIHEVLVTPAPTGGDTGADAGPDAGGDAGPGADAGDAGDAGNAGDIGEGFNDQEGDLSGSSCACDSVQREEATVPGWLLGAMLMGGFALWRRRRWIG